MNLLFGIVYHAIGAFSASVCYLPQKKAKLWSWQTYWLAQAAICWLFLPILVAWLTIPSLLQVLKEAPTSAMISSYLFGALYGIGGTAFGIGIRYLGFSLSYAISIGISCILGTLLPPLINGNLTAIFSNNGSEWIVGGLIAGVIGIALCGKAGHAKEKDMKQNNEEGNGLSFKVGLAICILSGVLAAAYGFSINQGQPIADVAAKYGAGDLQGNVIYLFSNSGAFTTTLIYCLYLHFKHKTFYQYRTLASSMLIRNFAFATLTGILWFTQFLFYGMGHVNMGDYKFTSWAIHMIMLVLFSSAVGIVTKEWSSSSASTRRSLYYSQMILIIAVLLLMYGNYLGTHH